MLKRELMELLVLYNQQTSFFDFFLKDNKEITAIKAILSQRQFVHLLEEDELPTEIMDALKKVLNESKNPDPKTADLINAIYKMVFINNVSDWQHACKDEIPEACGSATIAAHPTVFQLSLLQKKALEVYCDNLKAESEHNKKNLPHIHGLSRRLFSIETGQKNAWIHALLNHVVRGEQDKAEEILKKYPQMALIKGKVTDYANREMSCTVFQYAVWAGDWYMYKMLKKYMTPAACDEQLDQLNKFGLSRKYGTHFDFNPLIRAYQNYNSRPENLSYKLEEALWLKVAEQQAMLPMHVINQFFHPTRSFFENDQLPEFKELTLPRNSKFRNDSSAAFPMNGNYDFGIDYGLVRGDLSLLPEDETPHKNGFNMASSFRSRCDVEVDLAAIRRLADVIKFHRDEISKKIILSSEEGSAIRI